MLGERGVPVGAQGVAEPAERPNRIDHKGPRGLGYVPVGVGQADLAPNDVRGGCEDALQLFFEIRIRPVGRRCDEIGAIAVGIGEQGPKGLQVQVAGSPSRLVDPRQVEDVLSRVRQSLDALNGLPDRAEREPGFGQVLGGQVDADHRRFRVF